MPNLLHTHEITVRHPVESPNLNSVVDTTLVRSQESIHISMVPKKFSISASLSIKSSNFLPNVKSADAGAVEGMKK